MEIKKWFSTRDDGAFEITLENTETHQELHAVLYEADLDQAYLETEFSDLNGPVNSLAEFKAIIDELERRLH